ARSGPVILAFQVGLIRTWLIAGCDDRSRLRHELTQQRSRDASGDVGLHREPVGGAPLVRLRPQLRLGGGLNQTCRDPHARTVATRAALEQVLRLQRVADLTRPLQAALEEHRRPAADDADLTAAQRSELRDEFLGETVAEVFLAAIVTEIAERQHHEAHLRCRRRSGRVRADARHAPDEPIPTPRDRLDERRLVRIVAKRGAQALDRGVQAVLEVDERALGPETLTQLVTGDDLAGPLEHEPEDLERLLLQAHPRAAVSRNAVAAFLEAAQFTRPHVELEVSES